MRIENSVNKQHIAEQRKLTVVQIQQMWSYTI